MRRHPKASAVRSTLDAGSSARSGRVVATRGASCDVEGSGAPAAGRTRLALLALAVAAFALLALAPLSQAKIIINGFGTTAPASGVGNAGTPSLGGQFPNIRGIAVNNSGNGGVAKGTVYVVDASSRIQRFSAAGIFQRAWGQNVLGRDERQQINLASGSSKRDSLSGSFTLSFGGDSTTITLIPPSGGGSTIEPPAATVKSALEAMPSIGAGNVEVGGSLGIASGKGGVAGGPFMVRFVGALGGTDVPQITIDGSQLLGTPPLSASITTIEDGSGGNFAGFEICTVASQCKDGQITGTTANGGQLNSPQGVAVNQANGHVYVTESGNRRVSEFDADGNFVRAWGADVLIGGVTTFEICNVAANCKQAAAAGADGGRFGGVMGYPVTDSANNVWIPDGTNRRIQEFDSSGNFIAAYGYNVDKLGGGGALETCTSTASGACQAGTAGATAGQFSAANPTQLALDSTGNIYAIDAGNNRVQKFDPAFTSATKFAAATFSAFTTTAPGFVISTQGGTRLLFAVSNNVTAAEEQLLEIDPTDASVKDTSMVGSKLNGGFGLAEESTTGNIYATTIATTSPRKVLILSSTALPDPVLTVDAVTTKTDTTATFSGTVNPKGGWVACTFQYSTDQVTWTDVAEPDCNSLSPTGGVQAVSQSVTGLAPGSHYFVRLSVSRPLASGSAKATLAKAFDTDGAAPSLSNVGVTELSDTSARLLGIIDPRNSASGYVFQYGTTPSLGSSTAPVNIGGGTTPLLVSQLITGLKPHTTYYFKLVATNLVGTTTSPGQSFTTRTDPPALPDHRAYEQVSPPDKNYGGVDFSPLPVFGNAPDGEAAGFCTGSGISTDPEGQLTSPCTNYVSRRGAGSWGTKALNPYTCGFPFSGVSSMPTLNFDYAFVQVPLKGEGDCAFPSLAPGAPTVGPGFALYRENLLTDPVGFDLLAPAASSIVQLDGSGVSLNTSDDASHLVYRNEAQQTADAPANSALKIYDWDEGSLSLVSKDPANQAFTTSSLAEEDAVNGVSTSGDRIFFQNPTTANGGSGVGLGCLDSTCEIYMRENATTTNWVSQQECTVACSDSVAPDLFEWATPNGSKVFFRSVGKLIDSDAQGGADLYLYTQSANPAVDKNLTLLSKDNEPADGTTADMRGVLGASDDGNTVYFVANGQLILGQPTAAGPKIYRWQWNGGSPTIDYLTTLLPGVTLQGDERLWEGTNDRPLIRLVTPDGKYLLVQTQRQLDPIADQDSTRDVYRWSEAAGWVCASCQASGTPSSGASKIDGTDLTGLAITVNQGLMNREMRIVMSDDGQRVFFTSSDALSLADQNGTVEDVYEWHDGSIGLISSGQDQRQVVMLGSSTSGRDIFFITFDKLVGWDTDSNTDIYDARINGGFPEPPPTGAPCEGEACRGAASVAAPSTGAGTAVFQGPGNPTPPKATCPKGKVRRHGKCVKKPGKKRAKHSQRRASR